MFYLIHYNLLTKGLLTKNTSLKQSGNITWSVQTIKQENGREIIQHSSVQFDYISLVCNYNN
jgi:hypothetical protein